MRQIDFRIAGRGAQFRALEDVNLVPESGPQPGGGDAVEICRDHGTHVVVVVARHPSAGVVHETISSPVSVPVLEPNLFTSMPSRCSMLTKRLHSGGWFFGSKARCWPCRKPPPASSTGKFVVE